MAPMELTPPQHGALVIRLARRRVEGPVAMRRFWGLQGSQFHLRNGRRLHAPHPGLSVSNARSGIDAMLQAPNQIYCHL